MADSQGSAIGQGPRPGWVHRSLLSVGLAYYEVRHHASFSCFLAIGFSQLSLGEPSLYGASKEETGCGPGSSLYGRLAWFTA
jgi:hypothetical protein